MDCQPYFEHAMPENNGAGGDDGGSESDPQMLLLINTVCAVIWGRKYPPKISPTKEWNEGAFQTLALKWYKDSLQGAKERYLQQAGSLTAFSKDLEDDFTCYLLKRTAVQTQDDRYRALLQEYIAGGYHRFLGSNLYAEIAYITRQFVKKRHYPRQYSPTYDWDEDGYTALTNDFLQEKLLTASRQLEYLLIVNGDLIEFQGGIQKKLSEFLPDQRPRTILGNLFERTDTILNDTPDRFRCFLKHRKRSHSHWGLASWTAAPPSLYAEGDQALIQIANQAQVDLDDSKAIIFLDPYPTRTDLPPQTASPAKAPDTEDAKEASQRLPRVLSNPALADFLEALFLVVNHCLTLDQLVKVFQSRFNLQTIDKLSLEKPFDPGQGEDGQSLKDVLADEDAGQMVVDLDDTTEIVWQEMIAQSQKQFEKQRYILRRLREKINFHHISKELHCAPTTVTNHIYSVMNRIRNHLPVTTTGSDVREVFERIKDRCISFEENHE